jgi:nucleotidyltransferase/DNA polymerase involved in DNA repair
MPGIHPPSHSAPIMIRSWPRAILHIDTDAFFASCEQSLHPEYRGRPVITGKERGIVATASYEARARGVTRGVPLWEVKKLCPDAIILPSDYETYSLFSKRMFQIIRRFTPLVEEYSIDEAFVEITGLRRMYHASYPEIALKIKSAIESELGITVSVGLSLSKVLAKIGSKHKKPAGFTPIPGRAINAFLAVTPLEKVWGMGPQTSAYSRTLGMKTALDFAKQPREYIEQHFTKPHKEMWYELNGHAVYEIATEEKTEYATISKTKTFTPPSTREEYVFAQLLKNLENACIKARRYQLVARGIVLFIKTQQFEGRGVEAQLSRPSAYPPDMSAIVRSLFKKIFRPGTLYRSTGVILTGLSAPRHAQQSLFESPLRLQKLERVYQAIDSLAERWGKHCVHLVGSTAAHKTPQHVLARGDIPQRKLSRIKGESKRKHLSIPMLMHPLH